MNREQLFEQILKKRSFLSVGLDTDIKRIPKELHKADDPLFEFNKQIIDATQELAVAYKINTAFYEAFGSKGWDSMKKTLDYIPKGIFKIADAKRGDIGNTTQMYARAFFEEMSFDAVTLSPYMGADAIKPYLEYKDKTAIVLGLTSNEGSQDFQMLKTGKTHLFEKVISTVAKWGNEDNLMFVIGATHPEMFESVRKIVPNHFLLVPGVGAQGGDFTKITKAGFNKQCGLLVNSSRAIIYASERKDFKVQAMKAAFQVQREMEFEMKNNDLI